MNENKKDRLEELSDKYLKEKSKKDLYNPKGGLYKGYVIGINLFTHVLVGIFMGYGLDKFFETSPLFILIFIFLGFAAGMWQVYKESMK
jgi:F0F1-type ATP synthase assembly protein I